MKALIGIAAVFLMLAFPETVLNAALSATETWYYSVAPALFPFMVLLPLLTCAESVRAWERLLGWFVRPVLNLPGAAAPAVVIAMTAGSPAGAHAAVRICSAGGMTVGQLERILMCACGFSPAFLITGIGASMLEDVSAGHILLRAQLFSQAIMLLLTRNTPPGPALPAVEPAGKPESIRTAVQNVLAVCGYMAFFAALAAIAARVVRSAAAGLAVLSLLDVPTAARAIAGLSIDTEGKLLLLAALTGSGGLCIAAQNLAACEKMGVRPGKYASARLTHALLNTAAVALQLQMKPHSGSFFRPSMEFFALISAFLALPALIFWKKDPFLNKGNFEKSGENVSKKA